MTVYDLVALGRFPHTNWLGKIENEDNQIITNSLEQTSMASFSARFINEISDGERQKAMIARLLAQDTSIMILDEPTAFLDVSGRYEIIHLLHKLAKESLKTIIFSTHDLQMAVSQADKVWLLLGDRLVEGAPEDLMLSGAFGELFESSSVHFDRKNGTFSFMEDTAGSIYVEGEGDARRWTDKALNRAGYIISSEMEGDYIVTPKSSGQEWKLISGSEIKQFHSIYELIRELTVPGI